MKKLSDYITFDENGKPVFDDTAFNSDLDRERNNASETARNNAEKKLRKDIETEIRQQIEEDAKLTAEQKLAKEKELLDAERKKFNADRIKNLYTASGMFDESEIENYTSLITDNYEESVAKANTFINARKAYQEKYEKEIKEKLQNGTPRPDGGNGGGEGESEIAKLAKSYGSVKSDEVVFD
jgi:hypothetical protein